MENNFKNMKMRNRNLSKYASKDNDAIRLNPNKEDFRTAYFRDIDRILYSLSYTRYIDKTQVFSFEHNDMISKRMTHIQLVSKIARTIGRGLGLNEDLIEAASLGHDLGHVPFGHEGEKILNKLSLEYGEGYFNHNVQSVRILMDVENNGNGLNLTVQTLDGILCHNGELCLEKYVPTKKSKEDFLNQYNNCYTNKDTVKHLVPMTLEGCVVRICDIIGYIGRDIEDAVRLGILKKEDIPESITSVLGTDNKNIIDVILNDVIENSIDKPYIKMSEPIYKALYDLKEFNYENIYSKANTKEQIDIYNSMFSHLFNVYLEQLKNKDTSSDIYTIFLNSMNDEYKNNNSNERIVIDYIAGMTDDFFLKQYDKYRMK